MKYSSRFFLYAPLGVFLLLLAATGLHWWFAASRLADWLDARNGHEIMPGVTLSFSARHITGFPFSLDTQFRDVALTVAASHGPTRWQAEKFAMHALTYGRNETIFEAAGHQRLEWTGANGARHSLTFVVGALRASAIVTKGALSRFDLDLVGFGSKAFMAKRLQFHARLSSGDRIDILAEIDRPMAGSAPCPMAMQVTRFEVAAHLSETHVIHGLLTGAQEFAAAATVWRKAGGKSEIDRLAMPVDMRAPLNYSALKETERLFLPEIPAEQWLGVEMPIDVVCARRKT